MKIIGEIFAGLLMLAMIIGIPVASHIEHNYGLFAEKDYTDVVLNSFENGGFPKAITVKQGDTVRLRLTSHDVTHGFIIGDLGIDAGKIHAGKYEMVEFVAQEKGKFSYVCSVVCSPLHSKIRGYLIVE